MSAVQRHTPSQPATTVGGVVERPFKPTFEAFARTEYRKLVGTLSLYCGDPDVAAEIAHDALVRALERWDRVSCLDSPSGWLFRVAFNLVHSRYRRRKAERRAMERIHPVEPESGSPTDFVEQAPIRAAVVELPPYQRRVVVLRYYLGLSVEETAIYLSKSPGSVKSATHRALASLRKTLIASNFQESVL